MYSSGCGNPQFKGDDVCDDENNNAGCDFDGGDCCGPDVNKDFCTVCACHNITVGMDKCKWFLNLCWFWAENLRICIIHIVGKNKIHVK